MRSALVLCVACLSLAACGGRTATSSTTSNPQTWKDGFIRPDTSGRVDYGVVRPDGAVVVPDRGVLLDAPCLPVPASQVQGNYYGTWSGSWSCPNQPGSSISGKLVLTLVPAGSGTFSIKGDMQGMVSPGIPFAGNVNGDMICTSLHGVMPEINVGSGAIMYKLKGTLDGVYGLNSAGAYGFSGGSWTAKQQAGGSCSASGTWSANR